MYTEKLVENIIICENIISDYKNQMDFLISEIENKKLIMENINFDFENLYEITREISDNYRQLNKLENRIADRNDEIKYYMEKLEFSVSKTEFENNQKLAELENIKNLDKNLTEIMEKFKNNFDEIKILKNEIRLFKTVEKNYKNIIYSNKKYKHKIWVEVKILDDNSYQFRCAEKNINIKRKSTIIKYITQILMAN